MTMRTEIATSWHDLHTLESEWLELLDRSDVDEPTLTPLWLGQWWKTFGRKDGRKLRAVVLRQDGRLIGLAPLVQRRHWYRPGLPFRRIELLASGECEADEICSDYIGVIAERGRERNVARALCDALRRGALGAWDELVMPAMNGETALPWALVEELKGSGFEATCESTSEAPYISLPARWDDYLAQLPQSHRYFVKRSVRDFERWAGRDLRFEHAKSERDLQNGLAILSHLHRQRWQATGEDGVFASDAFMEFHRAVLPELLQRGALDLCWMTARGEPLGALYNIVHRGKVYFYQSGRTPHIDSRLRPGVVLHAYSIRRAIERGYKEYDFLAGTSRYKMQLALNTRPIVCLRAARRSLLETARALARRGALHFRTMQLVPRQQEMPAISSTSSS